jgi:hypothetical protein
MAQEQIELEFREELQQVGQMIQMLQNPQAAQQNPNLQNQVQLIQNKIESRKAVLIAEMMEEFKNEEKKITSQFDHDPIAKLRARELDIRAMDNEAKRKEAEQKINIDRMRAMMNQTNVEEKMDQNEDLAELRAETSLEKQEMANENRLTLARMKPKTNGRT